MEFRVGQGYDVHRLKINIPLIIGGVKIPYKKGLVGHSDSDVLIHAIIDAILGAASLGDIGSYFPNSDNYYKNIDSRVLLKKISVLVKEKEFFIQNIDSTIVAQEPKFNKKYIDIMNLNISQDLNIPINYVNIKVKTNEKLGYIGKCKGIEAQSVVLLMKK